MVMFYAWQMQAVKLMKYLNATPLTMAGTVYLMWILIPLMMEATSRLVIKAVLLVSV